MGHLARMIVIEETARVYPSLGFFFQAGNLLMYAWRISATRSRRSATFQIYAKATR